MTCPGLMTEGAQMMEFGNVTDMRIVGNVVEIRLSCPRWVTEDVQK